MQSSQAVAGPSNTSSSSSTAGKPDRLFVGNLSPTVDEYALLQIFSKYGKITKLNFMFHKSGVLKGKPRGYAFVEFANKDDALKAMVKLHDRLLRGRKLVVTYASSAPVSDLPLPTKGRRHAETPKTTTLSLLKSRRHPQSASAQIAAMEAKLASMAKKKPADEDYVPGQSVFPLGSASGSASPAPDEDMEYMLGQEEGERAADDLERELQAELDRGEIKVEDEDIKPPLLASAGIAIPSPGVEVDTPPTTAKPTPISLPSKPNFDPAPANTASASTSHQAEQRSTAKEEAFKKGLAGLPKKPVF